MLGTYDDNGVRFVYPSNWEIEVTEDGPRTTIAVTDPGGTAFALVTLDGECPAPKEVVDEVLEAMTDEYPDLDAYPARERINGHSAIGHDIEFFSLDFVNACTTRCFRTPRHTVLLVGQWSTSVDGELYAQVLAAVRQSFAESNRQNADS